MPGIDALQFKPGDPLKAADLQMLRDAVVRPDAQVRGGPGVNARKGPRGDVQLTATGSRGYVGTADANIAARSGSTWGTGTVTLLGFDGSAGYSLGVSVDVVNPSSSKMTSGNGIDSGMMCLIEQTDQGWWIVMPLECA